MQRQRSQQAHHLSGETGPRTSLPRFALPAYALCRCLTYLVSVQADFGDVRAMIHIAPTAPAAAAGVEEEETAGISEALTDASYLL